MVVGGWLRGVVSLAWCAADPALAPVSYEAAWADVPPDWFAGRSEYEEERPPR